MTDKAKELLRTNSEDVREIVHTFHRYEFTFDSFVKEHTTTTVRFKDFHGNEVRDGEMYWFVMGDFTLVHSTICDFTSGKDSDCTYFKFQQAAKDWIELNKPCVLSVNEIIQALNVNNDWIKIHTAQLLEIIRKKEAK